MLLVEGASDGGGAGFGDGSGIGLLLTSLPAWVPVGIGLIALATYMFNVRKSARDALGDFLGQMTSKEIASARRVAAEAAAWDLVAALEAVDEVKHSQGGVLFDTSPVVRYRESLARYEDAAHQLMWLVALAPSAVPKRGWVTRAFIGGSLKVETAQVYWHLSEVVEDLQQLIARWGGGFDWERASYRVDQALDYLPDAVPDYAGARIRKPYQRLNGAASAMGKVEKARLEDQP